MGGSCRRWDDNNGGMESKSYVDVVDTFRVESGGGVEDLGEWVLLLDAYIGSGEGGGVYLGAKM